MRVVARPDCRAPPRGRPTSPRAYRSCRGARVLLRLPIRAAGRPASPRGRVLAVRPPPATASSRSRHFDVDRRQIAYWTACGASSAANERTSPGARPGGAQPVPGTAVRIDRLASDSRGVRPDRSRATAPAVLGLRFRPSGTCFIGRGLGTLPRPADLRRGGVEPLPGHACRSSRGRSRLTGRPGRECRKSRRARPLDRAAVSSSRSLVPAREASASRRHARAGARSPARCPSPRR